MTNRERVELGLQTQLLHPKTRSLEAFRSTQVGTFDSATIFFPNSSGFRNRNWLSKENYIYGTHGTPTTFELEDRISTLEGGRLSLLCPSGLSAITLVYSALLGQGDELLVPINVYAANRNFITTELVKWGVGVRLYDPTDLNTLEISPATKLIWVEAPCSITFEFPDINTIIEIARRQGVLTALDNTWGAGVALKAFELGIDISVQSLSKFAGGNNDVVMGSVTCVDDNIYGALKLCAMRWGLAVSSTQASAVLKGLASLHLRYRAQDTSARWLTQRLKAHAAILEVLHPAVEESMGHEFWSKVCNAAAGLFSIVLKAKFNQDAAAKFVDSLRLFKIGFGWGGPVSLVLPYGNSIVSLRPITGELVRFSIGLEEPADLLADIEQALAVMKP